MSNDLFNVLRAWATRLGHELSRAGSVQVREPELGPGALTVDIELRRTLAQLVLWPTARMEIRIIAVQSGIETIQDDLELASADQLEAVLAGARDTIIAMERDF